MDKRVKSCPTTVSSPKSDATETTAGWFARRFENTCKGVVGFIQKMKFQLLGVFEEVVGEKVLSTLAETWKAGRKA